VGAGRHFESAIDVRKPVVLVVDDEPLVRWSVSETLRDSGYDVTEAADAASALRAVATPDNRTDVVLLDLWLPESNDLRVLGAIQALSPRTPVILMTAHGTQEVLEQARASGALMTLQKPFDMSALPPLIGAALAARGD
jgi:two-component system, NtrC family, response regulator AtoC